MTTKLTARTYFSIWYCVGVLLLMNILTSFFISGFILKIGEHNVLSDPNSPHSSKINTEPIKEPTRDILQQQEQQTLRSKSDSQFIRRNILTVEQSSLDETMLEYPQDDEQEDEHRNSIQMIIDSAKSNGEKKKLQYLSERYSVALKNERVSEVKSLLTSATSTRKTSRVQALTSSSSDKRKNFIVDCQNVRDLSDQELMNIMQRMMEPPNQFE